MDQCDKCGYFGGFIKRNITLQEFASPRPRMICPVCGNSFYKPINKFRLNSTTILLSIILGIISWCLGGIIQVVYLVGGTNPGFDTIVNRFYYGTGYWLISALIGLFMTALLLVWTRTNDLTLNIQFRKDLPPIGESVLARNMFIFGVIIGVVQVILFLPHYVQTPSELRSIYLRIFIGAWIGFLANGLITYFLFKLGRRSRSAKRSTYES